MILIKSLEIKFLKPLLVSFTFLFKSVDHLFMVTSALDFISCLDELTHLYVKSLSFALVGEQLVCFTNQKEVVVELFFRAPVSDGLFT